MPSEVALAFRNIAKKEGISINKAITKYQNKKAVSVAPLTLGQHDFDTKLYYKDPKTKKRFTVIVNEKTKPDGLKTLGNLKKKNQVEGAYVVTDAGLYIAVKLEKK